MVAEATTLRGRHDRRATAAAARASGEVVCLGDGRAGVKCGLNAAASGDAVKYETEGQMTVIAKSSEVWCDGDEIFWDVSANAATVVPPLVAGDEDFFLGSAVGNKASAATSAVVNLNVKPRYIIDLHESGGDTAPVLTAGTPTAIQRGGTLDFLFSATAEAQKLDWLSKRSFPVDSGWIADFVVEVVVNADADVADLSIGVANDTHASDADSITEAALFHFDMGADLNLDAESDDGSTEVAATDTTVDWAVGTPIHLKLDGRDPANVKFYANGVELLAATADLGDIEAATGPLKLLLHLEKSANDSPGRVQIDQARVRLVGPETTVA